MLDQESSIPTVSGPRITDPLLGVQLDGTTIEALVAETISSRTYRARRADGSPVRVWIAADHLARDQAFLARLGQEALLLARLHHIHVETCHGVSKGIAPDGRPLVALVEDATAGLSLGELARQEPLPVRDVLRSLHEIASALGAAHRLGLVHGDITQEAILVSVGGAAKLRSFSLGVSGYSVEQADNSLIGSPDYMAPEVGRGQRPSNLSDLYAIGAVLVTLLTGEVPYPAATTLETIHRHASAPVPDLAASHPEFASVAGLVSRLMAKDPAQRWMDVDELARDFLVLSNQIGGEVRCRPWAARRPVPVAARVQTALAQRQDQVVLPPPPTERASGGTTTISRKSIDVFRNPDAFKPTGLTPANGLPILPPSSDRPATTRTIRRYSVPPSAAATAPTPQSEPSPPSGMAAPPRTASYLSQLAASATTTVPESQITPRAGGNRTIWVIVVVVVVGVLVALGAWGLRPKAVPVAAPVTSAVVETPKQDPLATRIAAVIAESRRDPAAALAAAAALRREQPTADLARLPGALQLTVIGPSEGVVRVTAGGESMACSPGLLLCRVRGEEMRLQVSAMGFRTREVVVPASTEESLALTVTLLDAARWSMPEFAPTWVRLLPSPAGILLASDRKVVLVGPADGREVQRLDQAAAPFLPENPTWAAVLPTLPGKLRLGASGGSCVEVDEASFVMAREIHRGRSSVLSLRLLPLTLRLGEEGIFLIERDSAGFALAADNRERRLWSRPLKSAQVPWFIGQGDQLVVVGDRQVHFFSQEGEEVRQVALPAPRIAEPAQIGGGVIIPTGAGALVWSGRLTPLPGSAQPLTAFTSDAGMLVGATGTGLMTWLVQGEQVVVGWNRTGLVDGKRKLIHLALSANQIAVVDDLGEVQLLQRSDGSLIRIVRTGAPLLAPPLLVGELLVVVLAPGVVSAF